MTYKTTADEAIIIQGIEGPGDYLRGSRVDTVPILSMGPAKAHLGSRTYFSMADRKTCVTARTGQGWDQAIRDAFLTDFTDPAFLNHEFLIVAHHPQADFQVYVGARPSRCGRSIDSERDRDRSAESADQRPEFDFYRKNLRKLKATYPDAWVAILDEDVVGSGTTPSEAIDAAGKTARPPFIVFIRREPVREELSL